FKEKYTSKIDEHIVAFSNTKGGKGLQKAGDLVTEKVTERVTEKVTENQQNILKSVANNSHITALELASVVGISERKIKENIRKLKQNGLLRRIGAAMGGHWEVVEG
ncbi:MAG TPA: winged helix-turn-helix transcriptional regulator, partial [Anaerovoracaceae bacterium]|nr:winged helix-turn-helix transcriptional regulator [Anaerovoracaceae bacterium]